MSKLAADNQLYDFVATLTCKQMKNKLILKLYFVNVEGIIAVNATIMMTIGSIFISTFNSLPASTYIKVVYS